jgi:hypothetical protein
MNQKGKTGEAMKQPNPVFLMLAEESRFIYGEALDYHDHAEFGDRAEAAVALCEAGAIRKRATRHKTTGRVVAWTYSVASQDRSSKRFYSVSEGPLPECECPDWSHRMRLFRGELERVGSQAVTLPIPVPCKHILALRWMLALQAIFPSIEIEMDEPLPVPDESPEELVNLLYGS